jgi:hypothetical protein
MKEMMLKTSSKLTLAISLVASACAVQGANKKLSIWHHAASIQTEIYNIIVIPRTI